MPEVPAGMIVGDARSGTGLAGEIADAMKGYDGAFDPSKKNGWYLANSIAEAVVAHITANAVVTVESGILVTVTVPAGTGTTTGPGTGTIA